MRTLSIAITLILTATISLGQTAESLKERIQEHYTAINAGDSAATSSHHLQEFSIFPANGNALFEPGSMETSEKMGHHFNMSNLIAVCSSS